MAKVNWVNVVKYVGLGAAALGAIASKNKEITQEETIKNLVKEVDNLKKKG